MSAMGCQLQACNALHVVLGLVAVAMGGTQLSKLRLENYQQIDFRLLNWIHILTGVVGMYMVRANYGSIGAKVLYLVTIIVGLFSGAFYAATLPPVIQRYEELRRADGELVGAEFHKGRIAVCVVMIVISFLQAGIGLTATKFLNRLASEGEKAGGVGGLLRRGVRGRLAFVGVMKAFFGLLCVGLGAGMEVQYKVTDQNLGYIKIGWELLAGWFVFASGLLDVVAIYGARHNLLNLKVSLILSTIAAVVSLKTVDVMMTTYFFSDVVEYTKIDENSLGSPRISSSFFTTEDPSSLQARLRSAKQEAFKLFTLHAACLGCLVVAFFHCVIAAMEAGSMMEKLQSSGEGGGAFPSRSRGSAVAAELKETRSCLGFFQFVWGFLLLALCILSLVPWEFAEGYAGGQGLLWVGLLFMTAGSVSASRPKSLTTSVYVLSVISAVVSLEKLLFTINSVYQASASPRYAKESGNKHTGRIVLYCVQGGVLAAEFITAMFTANHLEKAIRRMGSGAVKKSRRQWVVLLVHMLYAVTALGAHVASVVGVWLFSASIRHSFVPFTNGPIVLVTAIMQLLSAESPEFLLSYAISATVSGTVAFFVIPQAATNLAYLHAFADIRSAIPFDEDDKTDQVTLIAMIVAGALIVIAMMEVVAAVASALKASFLIHHFYAGRFPASHRLDRYHNMGAGGSSSNVSLRKGGRRRSRSVETGSSYPPKASPPEYAYGAPPGQKYFGNDFRTYTEGRLYGGGGLFAQPQPAFYGYLPSAQPHAPLSKKHSSSQTNLRNVFDAGPAPGAYGANPAAYGANPSAYAYAPQGYAYAPYR